MAANARSRAGAPKRPHERVVLLASVLLVAACGLAYEIVAGAVSTYLLGDGVVQFGITIGVFLSSMGVGSYASRWVRTRLLATFLSIEIAVGLLGAALAPMLLLAYAEGWPYALLLVAHLGVIGALTGAEIPLLLRLLERDDSLRVNASAVLGLDYAGALIGSLLVPIVLVPWIGSVGAGALFGVINLAVAVVGVWTFPAAFAKVQRRMLLATAALLMVGLSATVVFASQLTNALESRLYQDPVVYSEHSPFQRIVLTRWRGDLRLFLNGSLQFSSRDEYRYHESLVHPAMAHAKRHKRVLVLGGGDGCAVREVLRWPGVDHVDLVDLDPRVTQLARTLPDLVHLNRNSLNDARVSVHSADALKWLEGEVSARWDVILMDLPDPSTPGLARLYARSSLRLIRRHLGVGGALGCQATSPFFARDAFWCIADTIGVVGRSTGATWHVAPYRAVVPSFGTWGFVLASDHAAKPDAWKLPTGLRYLAPTTVAGLMAFPVDEQRPAGAACINRILDGGLARSYRKSWARFGE